MKVLNRKGLVLSGSKGFTLIELLVVIAIIGILSSVVLVSLNSSRSKAYKASALSSVSGLGTEFVTCYDDNGAIYGPASTTTGGDALCRVSTSDNANLSGHTTSWPDLTSSKYVYTNFAAQNANSSLTVTLTSAGNTDITCSWDGAGGASFICN